MSYLEPVVLDGEVEELGPECAHVKVTDDSMTFHHCIPPQFVKKCTLMLVDEYKHMLCQATEPLSTFLKYITRRIVAYKAPMAAPRMSVLMDNETSNTLSAETKNWQDLLAMYTGLFQEKTPDTNRMLEDINETPPPIVRNNRFQSLATSTHSSYQNHTSSQASTSFPY
ncbi:hypothetical protein Tco_0588199 [Tanacetum coccineum]